MEHIFPYPATYKGSRQAFPDIEIEELDINTKYNDFIITGLTHNVGIRTADIRERFGEESKPISNSRQLPICVKGCLSVKTTL